MSFSFQKQFVRVALLLPLLLSWELQPVREVKPSLVWFSVRHMVISRCFSPPFTPLFWTASVRSAVETGQLWVWAVRCGRTSASVVLERMEGGRKPRPDRNKRESGSERPRGPSFIVGFSFENKKEVGGMQQMNRSCNAHKTLHLQMRDRIQKKNPSI